MKERFPTKLKDAFQLIRNGKIDIGKKMMDEVKGSEHRKAIAMAELAYFQQDWAKGLELSCSFLPDAEVCHWSNIYDEHFAMIVLAAYKTESWTKVEKFLKELLKGYEKLKVSEQPKQRMFQIREKLEMIKNKAATIKFFTEKPKIEAGGKSLKEVIEQQKEYKPKLNNKEIEKADYMLHFLSGADFLKIYEKYAEKLDYLLHHQTAATEYMALGDLKKAQKALMRYAKKWWPIEHMQIEPVVLLTQQGLLPTFTKEWCLEIIKTPKGPK